jgi:hypothetical protein
VGRSQTAVFKSSGRKATYAARRYEVMAASDRIETIRSPKRGVLDVRKNA